MDQAKRKLQGASSMCITVEDLKSSIYYLRPNFQDFAEFVKGDESNLRFRFVIIIYYYYKCFKLEKVVLDLHRIVIKELTIILHIFYLIRTNSIRNFIKVDR